MSAAEFLIEKLKNNPMLKSEVEKLGLESGYSKSALDRAKSRIGVKCKKLGFNLGWQWSISDDAISAVESRKVKARAGGKKGRKLGHHKFKLPDIQRTICIFIEKNEGEVAEMLINSEFHDEVLYSDPQKYINLFGLIKVQIEKEIKKANDIINTGASFGIKS